MNEHPRRVPQGSAVHESLTEKTFALPATILLTRIPARQLCCCSLSPQQASYRLHCVSSSRSRVCQPARQSAIEFCFHYAGFPGSFKLVLILSSLLRPLKRGGVPTFLGKQGPIPVPRMAFCLARAVCPLSLPGPLGARPASRLPSRGQLSTWALGKRAWVPAARPTATWV